MGLAHCYLTASGWHENVALSEHAVERWKRQAEVINGRLTIDYSIDWSNPEWTLDQRNELRDSFELPEAKVSGRYADICWEIPA